MSTIFTIGEIAKLFNISTQALRLYDRIDLLKPAYINEETGYRYYSIGQFVNLECIKRCKAMGFSLEEIKDLLEELQDIFYFFKGEAMEQIADDELIEFMKRDFDGKCQGSIEYLSGTSLEELCRGTRYGLTDLE